MYAFEYLINVELNLSFACSGSEPHRAKFYRVGLVLPQTTWMSSICCELSNGDTVFVGNAAPETLIDARLSWQLVLASIQLAREAM